MTGGLRLRLATAILGAALAAAPHARAATEAKPDDAADVFPIWPGTAPGSENATWSETIGEPPAPYNGGSRWVRNVVRPTLTAFLPDRAGASGTAVVIAPGGGFRWLSIDSEGYDVARWLKARGVATFVLKYRLAHTPEDEAWLKSYADAFVAQLLGHPVSSDRELGEEAQLAVADGLQAMKVVRSRAAEWGVDPGRIGIMAFSAGGQVTNAVATRYDAESRPDFAAPIYGVPSSAPVPPDAPPLFLAASADDPLVAPATDIALFEAWRAGGHSAELHLFASGGHGYGDRKQGKTSDHWLDELGWWLEAQGLMKPRG